MERKDYNGQIHANKRHNEVVRKIDSLEEKLDNLIELLEVYREKTSKKKG
jgi:hypothetical protein